MSSPSGSIYFGPCHCNICWGDAADSRSTTFSLSNVSGSAVLVNVRETNFSVMVKYYTEDEALREANAVGSTPAQRQQLYEYYLSQTIEVKFIYEVADPRPGVWNVLGSSTPNPFGGASFPFIKVYNPASPPVYRRDIEATPIPAGPFRSINFTSGYRVFIGLTGQPQSISGFLPS